MDSSGSIRDLYGMLISKMDEIDAVFSSLSDAKSGIRRQAIERITEPFADSGKLTADHVVSLFDQFTDEDQLIAVYLMVDAALSEKFGKKSTVKIAAVVEKITPEVEALLSTTAPTYSDEELLEMRKQRKAMYDQARSMRDLLVVTMGENPEDFPEPKKATGGRGVKRISSFQKYNWTINGVPIRETEDTIKSWIEENKEALGIESVRALRKIMKESGVDFTKKHDSFVVSTKIGTLAGNIKPNEEAEEEDDSDDDSDDTDDE
jgi:hypothetical protein